MFFECRYLGIICLILYDDYRDPFSLSQSMAQAQDSFRILMHSNGENPAVLRMHASFLLEVINEQQHGRQLLDKATEMEDRRSKQGKITWRCKRGRLFGNNADHVY